MTEDYEVKRGFRFLFDVLPPNAWGFLVAWAACVAFAVYIVAHDAAEQTTWQDAAAVDVGPESAPAATTGMRVVSKGCKCRHRLAVSDGSWWSRDWQTVSFEDWDRARVGDPWPLPPVAEIAASQPVLYTADDLHRDVHAEFRKMDESFKRIDDAMWEWQLDIDRRRALPESGPESRPAR